MSPRLTAVAATSTRTSPGPGSGSGTSRQSRFSGPPGALTTIARMKTTLPTPAGTGSGRRTGGSLSSHLATAGSIVGAQVPEEHGGGAPPPPVEQPSTTHARYGLRSVLRSGAVAYEEHDGAEHLGARPPRPQHGDPAVDADAGQDRYEG